MNRRAWISVSVLALAIALLAIPVAADDHEKKAVTLEGKVMCAKCALHEEGRTKCQNVLVVEGEETTHYYISKNATADKFGEVCMGAPEVRVTGMIEMKDGKHWIVADKIEKLEADKG
jgi:hypothetical protein